MAKKGKTLLVVDDEADLREILAFSLERRGFEVLQASNGTEAFELVCKTNIDLIISDIQMPGGNGVKLLEDVRNHHYEVPVLLFITGFSDVTLEEAYDKGTEALFSKPFDINQVVAVVERALTPKNERWEPRSDREPTDVSIELRVQGFDEVRKARILNIGRGGMFIHLDDGLPKVSAILSFKIELSEGIISLIEGTGIVRWVRQQNADPLPSGIGVEFDELSDNTRHKVIELINFLKTKQYIPKN